ncbi:MAG: serine/threonine protein kinase [Planctomycetes bacterium]|nr:serine/threonine protein kinase [Planctomycetota bacterium]
MAGEVAGGYRIEKLLEEWPSGALYRAYQASLERSVLLRVDKLPPGSTPRDKAALLGAARRLGALNHSNVVRILEVGETADAIYCSMEYPGDMSLDRLMNEKGKLSPPEAVGTALQVLTALQYAFDQEGVIHGALRPQVVFITQDGFVKVAEFGMDRKRSRLQMGRDAQYVPPEKVSGGTLDERSDIYSLGAILYRALSGRLPFQDIDPRRVLARQVDESPRPLKEVSQDTPIELAAVVETAMRKDPRMRYQIPGQMASALQSIQV